jgi:hypothetical protein
MPFLRPPHNITLQPTKNIKKIEKCNINQNEQVNNNPCLQISIKYIDCIKSNDINKCTYFEKTLFDCFFNQGTNYNSG